MNAEALLAQVEARGVVVTIECESLLLRPRSHLTPELIEALKAHKAELMDLLRARSGPGVVDALPGGVTEAKRSLLAAEVVAMRLSEFARARLVVTVHSAVLNETVVFASDNSRVDPGEQRVVYRAAELRELLGLSAKELRSVHRTKKLFGGSIIPS